MSIATTPSTNLSWSKEEVNSHAEKMRSHVRDKFKQHGSLHPTLFFFATHEPKTATDQKAMILCPLPPFQTVAEKQAISDKLRDVARLCGATGCISLFECWMVAKMEPTEAEVEAFEAEWMGSLQDHPNRVEVVHMFIEHHRMESQSWWAVITRDKDGQPTLGEWQHQPNQDAEGLFADLLNQRVYS